jgi:hypothetical protein
MSTQIEKMICVENQDRVPVTENFGLAGVLFVAEVLFLHIGSAFLVSKKELLLESHS